jgi:hypothetical protein
MPLAMEYPAHREQHISILLPDSEWQIPDEDKRIEHGAFTFRKRASRTGSKVDLRFECSTRAPAVDAEQVPGYLEKLTAMQTELVYSLQRPAGKSTFKLASLNWVMVGLAGVAFVATIVAGVWCWRVCRVVGPVPPALPPMRHLEGLGGWLILMTIGLTLAPILRAGQLAQYWEGFFSLHTWQSVAMPGGDQFHPLYGPLLAFEVVGNAAGLGVNLLVLALLFAKRKIFPKVCAWFIVGNALFLTIDALVSSAVPALSIDANSQSWADATRAWLGAVIWGLYLYRSRRVRVTFVR